MDDFGVGLAFLDVSLKFVELLELLIQLVDLRLFLLSFFDLLFVLFVVFLFPLLLFLDQTLNLLLLGGFLLLHRLLLLFLLFFHILRLGLVQSLVRSGEGSRVLIMLNFLAQSLFFLRLLLCRLRVLVFLDFLLCLGP